MKRGQPGNPNAGNQDGGQGALFPTGLGPSQFSSLSRLTGDAKGTNSSSILEAVDRHLAKAKAAHAGNRLVNVALALAIAEAFKAAVSRWNDVPKHARLWLSAAAMYFAGSDDDEPDFSSPIGFEDDAEVMNACLRLAGLKELCVNPEDFDDA